jgi:superfamily II DNA or RNA helicase
MVLKRIAGAIGANAVRVTKEIATATFATTRKLSTTKRKEIVQRSGRGVQKVNGLSHGHKNPNAVVSKINRVKAPIARSKADRRRMHFARKNFLAKKYGRTAFPKATQSKAACATTVNTKGAASQLSQAKRQATRKATSAKNTKKGGSGETTPRLSVRGVYVATHPWLEAHGLVKVGWTNDVRHRLLHSAYVTCFPAGWRFIGYVPCSTSLQAHALEGTLLKAFKEHLVHGRELVRMPPETIVKAMRILAALPSVNSRFVRADESRIAVTPGQLNHDPSAMLPGIPAARPRKGPTKHTGSGRVERRIQSIMKEAAVPLERLSRVPTEPTSQDAVSHADENVDAGRQSLLPTASNRLTSDAIPTAHEAVEQPPSSMVHLAGREGIRDSTLDDDDDELSHADLDLSIAAVEDQYVVSAPIIAATPPPTPGGDKATTATIGAPGSVGVTLRDYQNDALVRLSEELHLDADLDGPARRTILQMACRCGKTPVAYEAVRRFVDALLIQRRRRNSEEGVAPPHAPVVVLMMVPGLALLRQTAAKLDAYGAFGITETGSGGSGSGHPRATFMPVLLGSDLRPLQLPRSGLVASMTTDPDLVTASIAACRSGSGVTSTGVSSHPRPSSAVLLLSTYQSSVIVPPEVTADMVVFDECHRTCGSTRPGPFNHWLFAPPTPGQRRLFMTATPSYDTAVSMADRGLFGGIASRYYLRAGIDAGHVNAFSLRVIFGPAAGSRTRENSGSEQNADEEDDDDVDLSEVYTATGRLRKRMLPQLPDSAMIPYLMEAMRHVNTMLVFCRSIAHAVRLCDDLATAPLAPGVRPFRCVVAHSRMPQGGAGAALQSLCDSTEERVVLFNCRMFQEGVEVPRLQAVFFAAPRFSPRDIIQSLCRPLNKLPGKGPSTVFLPAVMDTSKAATDPVNLDRFSTLVPFIDALTDEDPNLFEWLLDPRKRFSDVDVLGVRDFNLGDALASRQVLLSALRRGVRYTANQTDRLTRAARLPWSSAFAELRRLVETSRRYPKHTDAWQVGDCNVPIHTFYKYCREGYKQHLDGDATCFLQPHQIRDLESLPHWRTYGVYGPYPFDECLATLNRELEASGGIAPMLEINCGGFVGLSATPIERLSGWLTTINQRDGKAGLRVKGKEAAALDDVCARYKLEWRKPRHPETGLPIVPGAGSYRTFIQDSNARFRQQWNALQEWRQKHLPPPGEGDKGQAPPVMPRKLKLFEAYISDHFPGYPIKHKLQEDLDVVRKGLLPPRLAMVSKSSRNRVAGSDVEEVEGGKQLLVDTAPIEGGRSSDTDAAPHDAMPHAKRRGRPSKTQAVSDIGDNTPKRTKRKVRDSALRVGEGEHHRKFSVCRVCRIRVPIEAWSAHVDSLEHHGKLRELEHEGGGGSGPRDAAA